MKPTDTVAGSSPIGSRCNVDTDCLYNRCDSNTCTAPVLQCPTARIGEYPSFSLYRHASEPHRCLLSQYRTSIQPDRILITTHALTCSITPHHCFAQTLCARRMVLAATATHPETVSNPARCLTFTARLCVCAAVGSEAGTVL